MTAIPESVMVFVSVGVFVVDVQQVSFRASEVYFYLTGTVFGGYVPIKITVVLVGTE